MLCSYAKWVQIFEDRLELMYSATYSVRRLPVEDKVKSLLHSLHYTITFFPALQALMLNVSMSFAI